MIGNTIDRLDDFGITLSKTIDEVKWQPIEVKQWITTNQKHIRIDLSTPTDKSIVHKTPIKSSGRVVGLSNDFRFSIHGFVITNREYEQGSSIIDKDGYWKINEIHLGANS